MRSFHFSDTIQNSKFKYSKYCVYCSINVQIRLGDKRIALYMTQPSLTLNSQHS